MAKSSSLNKIAARTAAPVHAAVVRNLMKPARTPARSLRLLRGKSLREAVNGKVVVVTGASSGIGESSARQMAAAGAITIIVARRQEELDRVAGEINAAGGTAHTYAVDLSDFDAIDAFADQVLADHGRVDILINNAGRSIRRPIDESFERFHDFERTMQINYFGPVRLVLKLLPGMLERGSGQIINVATWAVQFEVNPLFSAYAASKAAITSFGRSVDAEVADRGVSVSTVMPALIRTPMVAPTAEYTDRPALTADEAADMIAEAVRTKVTKVAPALSSAAHIVDALSTVPLTVGARATKGHF